MQKATFHLPCCKARPYFFSKRRLSSQVQVSIFSYFLTPSSFGSFIPLLLSLIHNTLHTPQSIKWEEFRESTQQKLVSYDFFFSLHVFGFYIAFVYAIFSFCWLEQGTHLHCLHRSQRGEVLNGNEDFLFFFGWNGNVDCKKLNYFCPGPTRDSTERGWMLWKFCGAGFELKSETCYGAGWVWKGASGNLVRYGITLTRARVDPVAIPTSDKLHLSRSILTTFIHVLFGLSIFLKGSFTYINKK